MVITKEELNQLEVEKFERTIKVIDTIEEAEEACKALTQSEIIGFDTETKPAFRKGVSNKVALMQLSTEDICYLFRINKIGMPSCIVNLLANENVKKIGLSLKDDFHGLSKTYSFKPANFVELQNLVGEYDIEDQSLQKIYAILFNKRITKGQRLTNWEASELTEAQQMYAAIDAWACLRIYKKIMSEDE